MSPSIQGATGKLNDVNQLIVTVTGMIPVFGTLISNIVAIVARHRDTDPALVKTLQDGVARMQSELDKLAANDAAWRVEHPIDG